MARTRWATCFQPSCSGDHADHLRCGTLVTVLLPMMPESTPPWPHVLAMWTAVLGGCTDVVVQTDISYDERYDVAVLDVYSPPPAAQPRPAVITIHGGGW